MTVGAGQTGSQSRTRLMQRIARHVTIRDWEGPVVMEQKDCDGQMPPMWVALSRVANRHRGRGQPHPGALPTGPRSRTRTRHKALHDNRHGRGVESANMMPRQIHNCTICVPYVYEYTVSIPYIYRTAATRYVPYKHHLHCCYQFRN